MCSAIDQLANIVPDQTSPMSPMRPRVLATKLQLPELTDELRDTLTTNEMKSKHVYICDCQVLMHIWSNSAFPAPKRPLGHTGDLV